MSVQIACAADDAYAPYCAAMLHSLLSHNRWAPVVVHFLCAPAFSQMARQRLQGMARSFAAEIVFHEIAEDAVSGLPQMARIPRLMWFRVLLPDLLPQAERVLYLDADTLIVDSLQPLWETDLAGHYLGAVTNVIPPPYRQRPRELGLAGPEDYFNSGVLLFNLAAMRQERCTARILEYARANAGRLLWPDQDALNVILAPRRLALHPRWNCQNTLFYWPEARSVFGAATVAEATRAPAVLHFEGPDQAKPWHYLNDHPYRGAYRQRLRLTGFPVPPVQGITLKNVLRKYIPAGARLWRGWRRLRTSGGAS